MLDDEPVEEFWDVLQRNPRKTVGNAPLDTAEVIERINRVIRGVFEILDYYQIPQFSVAVQPLFPEPDKEGNSPPPPSPGGGILGWRAFLVCDTHMNDVVTRTTFPDSLYDIFQDMLKHKVTSKPSIEEALGHLYKNVTLLVKCFEEVMEEKAQKVETTLQALHEARDSFTKLGDYLGSYVQKELPFEDTLIPPQ